MLCCVISCPLAVENMAELYLYVRDRAWCLVDVLGDTSVLCSSCHICQTTLVPGSPDYDMAAHAIRPLKIEANVTGIFKQN